MKIPSRVTRLASSGWPKSESQRSLLWARAASGWPMIRQVYREGDAREHIGRTRLEEAIAPNEFRDGRRGQERLVPGQPDHGLLDCADGC